MTPVARWLRALGMTVSSRRAVLSLLVGAFVLSAIPGGAENTLPPKPVSIVVKATPIDGFDARDPTRRRFGALMFRGGLVLTSSAKFFGGISAIRVAPDGARFLALSDKGAWLQGRIVYRGDKPAGIADAVMAPILGPDGKPLAARGWYDTESLALNSGTAYVGIERVHRIVRFDYGRKGLLARGQPISVPPGVRELPNNQSLEALAFVPKGYKLAGTLIALSERGLDANNNLKAFLIGGPTPGEFSVKRSHGYDISDAALLPDGDLVILERRFSPLSGVAIRIRRIALVEIKPGALVDGPILIEADMGYQIDNMEGLTVHRTPAGETVLTLISDDNFSPLQRTLLLQFTLVAE